MTSQRRMRIRVASIVCFIVVAAGESVYGLAQWQGTLTMGGRAYGVAVDSFSRSEPTLTAEVGTRIDMDGLDLALGAWFRFDPINPQRSRLDAVDLAILGSSGDFDLTVGFRTLSWGVLESAWLVDIVNQVDPDARWPRRQTLSQPTVGVAWLTDWGTLEAYGLPWARPRPFEGRRGRLWSPHHVHGREHHYTASAPLGRHLAWVARWSASTPAWEAALVYFDGTARAPRFVLKDTGDGEPHYLPTYDRVRQIGLEAQYTAGSWLWKLELVTSNPDKIRYVALGCGIEYAIASHVSTFVEILIDSRGLAATTSLENDIFVGSRLFLNDGDLTAGAFVDGRSGNVIASLAAAWRLDTNRVLGVETRGFIGSGSMEPPLAMREETSISLSLQQYF